MRKCKVGACGQRYGRGLGGRTRCRSPQTSTVNISPGHDEYNSRALCVAVPQITLVKFVTRLTTG